MKYTVVWLPDAEAEIAQLWLDADVRSAVSSAANDVDKQLARHPLDIGESRDGEERIFFVRPLAARYIVDEADRRVQVIEVWLYH